MGQEHLRNKGEVSGAQQGIPVCPGAFQRVGTAQSVKLVVKHLLLSRWTDCGKWEFLWKIHFLIENQAGSSGADFSLINTKSFSISSPSTLITELAATGFFFQINP